MTKCLNSVCGFRENRGSEMLITSFFEELLFLSVAVLLDLISMVSQIYPRSSFFKNSNGQAPKLILKMNSVY